MADVSGDSSGAAAAKHAEIPFSGDDDGGDDDDEEEEEEEEEEEFTN
jgi:hypothetical protein